MLEIELTLRHRCPWSDLSCKFPKARFLLWDNFQKEFLDIQSDVQKDWTRMSAGLEALARNKGSKILRKVTDGRSYQFMIMTCACRRQGSTLDLIMESDCLFVPPILYENGVETYHVVGFDKSAPRRLLANFRSLGDAKIAKNRQVGTDTLEQSNFIPILDPLSSLTSLQLNALATSLALGYYRLPRRTSTGKIAATLKMPRTTFQEHRKKAETKLMAALTPYVLTYAKNRKFWPETKQKIALTH
jgi:predicted DNA binding protein